jgi:hypothetical protein
MLYLPTPPYAYSEVKVSLGGQEYALEYTFNEIDESWYLSIYLNDEPLKLGLKIVENVFLVYRYRIEEFDHGDIVCSRQTTNPNFSPLGRNNLGIGKEYTLVYFTNAELRE